jgi:hypothetical protein
MAKDSTRVAVFIDWQNVYKAAREAFGLGQLPNERGNFSPFKLARVLAAGHGRGSAGELLRVEVHRGLPSSSRDPVGYGANRRQATAWVKEGGSVVVPRQARASLLAASARPARRALKPWSGGAMRWASSALRQPSRASLKSLSARSSPLVLLVVFIWAS